MPLVRAIFYQAFKKIMTFNLGAPISIEETRSLLAPSTQNRD
jgi:hypothetical protein